MASQKKKEDEAILSRRATKTNVTPPLSAAAAASEVLHGKFLWLSNFFLLKCEQMIVFVLAGDLYPRSILKPISSSLKDSAYLVRELNAHILPVRRCLLSFFVMHVQGIGLLSIFSFCWSGIFSWKSEVFQSISSNLGSPSFRFVLVRSLSNR